MVRWEPGAKERLQLAAMDLYLDRGFEQTTAAEIALSVGLTERTFFRHFNDKREVLFDGQEALQQALLEGVDAAPAGATALELVAAALQGSAAFFPADRREHSRRRQRVITENAPLQERELLKMAGLAAALAATLRSHRIGEPTATIAAETAVTVFGVAFARWIVDGERRSMAELQHEGLAALRELAR